MCAASRKSKVMEAELYVYANPHASQDEKFTVKANEILEDWVTQKEIEDDENEIMRN